VRLHILARGRIGRGPEAELVARYEKRLRGGLVVSELGEDGAWPPPPPASRTIVMDERGDDFSSSEVAERLGRWRDSGVREVRLLLGAADGHGQAVRDGADLLWALGRATWPHLLARAMLAEQLYRAVTILEGHPYHRD
jgi:23S rRNA (pseudouridine1915-N3)-methyltransferase